MQFFHEGRPRNGGSKICTNLRFLRLEDVQTIMDDLNHKLKEEDITLGLKRVQHHDVVKIGYTLRMMDKIDLK